LLNVRNDTILNWQANWFSGRKGEERYVPMKPAVRERDLPILMNLGKVFWYSKKKSDQLNGH